MSGTGHLTGTADQPYRAQVNYVDFGTALHCAFGVMLALREREKTGRGQCVSGSLLGTALAMSNALTIDHALNGIERQPIRHRASTPAPTDMFTTHTGRTHTQVIAAPPLRTWPDPIGAAA